MSQCLILIGFKACGKTSVGELLAEKLGVQFLDTDRLLEARYASSLLPTSHDCALPTAPNSRGLTAGSRDVSKPMDPAVKPREFGCAEIYRAIGEHAFRALEKSVITDLQQAATNIPRVIATGGGVVLDPENKALLQQLGSVIYLYASYATLLSRLKSNPLPAFMSGDLETEFQTLFAQREPMYREMADRILNTKNYSVLEVVEQLV